jgi:1-acylglycerone phosphate reductase
MSPPTVLITGCSEGGIGAGLATGFAARGYHVYAAVRNPPKAGNLADTSNITVIKLDVTQAESVQSVAAELATQLPEGKLDILINNAGLGSNGPIIEADLGVMRQVYDVNVFGLLAVTQALVPMLIKAKGNVVNICSTAGIMPLAWRGKCGFSSLYSAPSACLVLQKFNP